MVFKYIGIGAGAVMILSLPLFFCAMFKKLDAAERYVKNSAYIVVHRDISRHAPFDGRPQRLVAMAIIILVPKIFQWRHLVRVEDVEKIPRHLKCWMVIPVLITFISFSGMCISWLFI
ncbi:MAG: hypothetical protein EOO38_32455 [Cytophagaceae bacterium]|nr:MAG: hypothetical protein EOO38_32455 [Cytophagaceae bacterium]